MQFVSPCAALASSGAEAEAEAHAALASSGAFRLAIRVIIVLKRKEHTQFPNSDSELKGSTRGQKIGTRIPPPDSLEKIGGCS